MKKFLLFAYSKNLFRYQRIVLLLIFLLTFSSTTFSQLVQSEIWQDVAENSIQLSGTKYINPLEYRTVKLNIENLDELLKSTPLEKNQSLRNSSTLIDLPLPDGSFGRFYFVESPVMDEELAIKYPEIKTFVGRGMDDPYAWVRFDFTLHGFHAMVRTPTGSYFIDPHNQGDVEHYISYYVTDFITEDFEKSCEVIYDESRIEEMKFLLEDGITTPTGPQLRTYRLALAATGEYTAFHGGTVELGLAAVVTAVNRVVGVYETDLAIRMVLVPNNDLLIYTDGTTDPYTNSSGITMLGENQTNIDTIIGTANYDIGHVFSTGGGGVAYLRGVCVATIKARGVTGLSNPTGDPFYIDYVAHEMGHQFGGNHTFSGNKGACSGANRNASTAYEPGSGTTIMAYAGICDPQNIQMHSDPYFHTISHDEIVAFTNFGSGNGCAVITNTGNSTPGVTVPAGGFIIPVNTPFALTGSATDTDDDPLTYSWEEFDLGPAGDPNDPREDAPIFRVFNPSTSPTRTFPKLSDLLNNTQTMGEILPSYSRNLKFRLVARDNHIGGGGVDYALISFRVASTAGPFAVTYPNTNVTVPGLSSINVTWNVANTDDDSVNVSNVNILLSVDGGQTYPYMLAANTPNDGSQGVTIPDFQTTAARIKVDAVGNVFFDISDADFTIDFDVAYSPTISVEVELPSQYSLWQNHPNPFNPVTKISFELPVDANVKLVVYNTIGQQVAELVNSDLSGGRHEFDFNANDLSSGIYYYNLTAIGMDGKNFNTTKKMILIR